MKALLAATAALALAACASQETQPTRVASADCKVVPMTAESSTGNPPKHVTELQQRFAEADLANSQLRYQQLARNGMYPNPVEETLRDCNR
ncbi:MAG TPA: hypothetical protein VH040_13675 [Usitatibacter sp.]|jgi:hypothetical protein|nr:hypothetical protein [Usitatibacter sp.]